MSRFRVVEEYRVEETLLDSHFPRGRLERTLITGHFPSTLTSESRRVTAKRRVNPVCGKPLSPTWSFVYENIK